MNNELGMKINTKKKKSQYAVRTVMFELKYTYKGIKKGSQQKTMQLGNIVSTDGRSQKGIIKRICKQKQH